MENKLTIAIPTYNRESAVLRLLKQLSNVEYSKLYEIIICDNCSPYDIETSIKSSFDQSFISKLRIIRRPFNIGGEGNIKNQFLLCETKWLWVIGDDDEIEPDCLDIIFNDIEGDPDCAFFKYSFRAEIEGVKSIIHEDDFKMNSLSDFIEYYQAKPRSSGSMAFMSNNLFNMEVLAPFIRFYFDYTTCLQIFPVIMALDGANGLHIRYRSSLICKYNEPQRNDHWNSIYVLFCFTMLQFVRYKSIDGNRLKDLMRIFTFIPFESFAGWCVRNKDKIVSWNDVSYLYRNFYKYSWKISHSIRYILLMLDIKYKIRILSILTNLKNHA